MSSNGRQPGKKCLVLSERKASTVGMAIAGRMQAGSSYGGGWGEQHVLVGKRANPERRLQSGVSKAGRTCHYIAYKAISFFTTIAE